MAYRISNNWSLKVITPPTGEPITLAEAKAHLRVDFSDDDAYITALITAVRVMTEQLTNRVFLTQTLDYFLDDFPRCDEIKLRKPSLQSVTGVYYTNSYGIESTMPADDYVVDSDVIPGRIFLKYSRIWPVAVLQPAKAVRIRYIAGYGLAQAVAPNPMVPLPLIQAMKILISHYYENREPIYMGRMNIGQTPMTYNFLIAPFKAVMLQ